MSETQPIPTTTTSTHRINNRGGNWQQQAWNNMQQAPLYPFAFNTTPNMMPNFGGSNQANPRRIFENQNYCHIHGHHIQDYHTNQTCKTFGPNHNPNTTKFNTMRGSVAKAHKTSCHHSTVAHPTQCHNVNLDRATYSGVPQDSHRCPTMEKEAEEGNKQTS